MDKPTTDERLNTLAEIVHDCFGIEASPLSAQWQEARYVVPADNLVRALESAYDIGLIAGYQLSRTSRTPA